MDDLLRATARAEASHFWFRGFRWFVAPLVRRALEGRSGARILDCGCGTGANLRLLGRFGSVYGFDLNHVGLYIGRKEGRRRLARASVTAVPFPSDVFDLVTAFDVLVTLDEEAEAAALAEMFRVARPGGSLLVNVAAFDMLRGDHSVLSHEVRRYTRPRLARALVAAGFTIERMTYTNAVLFVPLALTRAYHRYRGLADEQHATGEITVPPSPINRALSAALFLESLWLRAGSNAFGSSLLCLARKPCREAQGVVRT